LIGAAIFFSEVSVTSRVIAIIVFLLLTAPVAAHMIGRTSYFIGTKLWDKSVMNELKDQYDEDTHELYSGEEHKTDSKAGTEENEKGFQS
jgi:multicomponent Na+:H+ antiporter subunit G